MVLGPRPSASLNRMIQVRPPPASVIHTCAPWVLRCYWVVDLNKNLVF
jgi:hypothetical protein